MGQEERKVYFCTLIVKTVISYQAIYNNSDYNLNT